MEYGEPPVQETEGTWKQEHDAFFEYHTSLLAAKYDWVKIKPPVTPPHVSATTMPDLVLFDWSHSQVSAEKGIFLIKKGLQRVLLRNTMLFAYIFGKSSKKTFSFLANIQEAVQVLQPPKVAPFSIIYGKILCTGRLVNNCPFVSPDFSKEWYS